MVIIVDAMGGDLAPASTVNGCIDAIHEKDGFDVLLVGNSDKINSILKERKFNNSRLKVIHTEEIITNDDAPTKAIKQKKNSSMVIGFNLLKEKKGDVFVSAGNSGALMAGGLFILGRIKGVDRPALAPVVPTMTGKAMIIDGGANTVCKPINYLQFGIMGSIYMREIFDLEAPKVGLINVGAEEKKGNDVIKQAYAMLSGSNINFTGNIEGIDIPIGNVDVAVCDGFVGNVALKTIEGMGKLISAKLEDMYRNNIVSKVSYLLIKNSFNDLRRTMDNSNYGGAPLLGVNGNVIKSHGSSKAKTIKYAVLNANLYAKSKILERIKNELENMEVDDFEQFN